MAGRRPRVRALEPHWVDHEGEKLLVLSDRVGLFDQPVAVPPVVGFILSLCDGGRDEDEIRGRLANELSQNVEASELAGILDELERRLVLEGPACLEAERALIEAYRSAPSRPCALAGGIYPQETGEARRALAAYGADDREPPSAYDADVRAVVSPHIDYQRGGRTYHRVWSRAAAAVRNADVLVVFGTDHCGGPGTVTLTRQTYDTPFGPLETDRAVVDAVAESIGEQPAFAEELHHRREHSIELAAVWAASLLDGRRRPTMVPILCGSFHHYSMGLADPAADARLAATLDALKTATAGKRVVAVAAADLAHVGPAFGDPAPLDAAAKQKLSADDEKLVHAAAWGRADEFFGLLRAEQDKRRICGLPPIYMTLRLLGDGRGEAVRYEQCPADADGGSLVSIAGMLLW
jgi:AmmeMemoRadiSam system protein B